MGSKEHEGLECVGSNAPGSGLFSHLVAKEVS